MEHGTAYRAEKRCLITGIITKYYWKWGETLRKSGCSKLKRSKALRKMTIL